MTGISWHEIYRLLMEDPQQRDLGYRFNVAAYQMGDAVKAHVYKHYYGSEGIHAEMRIALADVIAQAHILALHQNLDFDVLEELGKERLYDFVKTRMMKKEASH